MKEENVGNRKVILTKWMLMILAVVTLFYMVICALNGEVPGDSFYTSFIFGICGIGGVFSAGNAAEYLAKMKGSKDVSTNS